MQKSARKDTFFFLCYWSTYRRVRKKIKPYSAQGLNDIFSCVGTKSDAGDILGVTRTCERGQRGLLKGYYKSKIFCSATYLEILCDLMWPLTTLSTCYSPVGHGQCLSKFRPLTSYFYSISAFFFVCVHTRFHPNKVFPHPLFPFTITPRWCGLDRVSRKHVDLRMEMEFQWRR